MDQKTFQVPNIDCAGCVRTVKAEIGQIPGVQRVDADQTTKMVTVAWAEPASWETIKGKLVEIDYAPA